MEAKLLVLNKSFITFQRNSLLTLLFSGKFNCYYCQEYATVISENMKFSHISVFIMSIVLAYGAPQIMQGSKAVYHDSDRIVVSDEPNKNMKANNPLQKSKKRCCPYNFDSHKCQIVNDRKVCGYDMNNEGPGENPAEKLKRLDNGCWFNRGRLECGYKEGPYTGIRRPPVYDRHDRNDRNAHTITSIMTPAPNTDSEYDDNAEKLVYKPVRESPVPRTVPQTMSATTVPSCVELRKTIVCGILNKKTK